MGLCNSPDMFQEKMDDIFNDLEFIRTYIDDLFFVNNSNLRPLTIIKNCFRETENIMPSQDKVQATKYIAVPTNKKQRRMIIGVINYNRYMSEHRSNLLTP